MLGSTPLPKAGTQRVTARWDLRGEPTVMPVPTAIAEPSSAAALSSPRTGRSEGGATPPSPWLSLAAVSGRGRPLAGSTRRTRGRHRAVSTAHALLDRLVQRGLVRRIRGGEVHCRGLRRHRGGRRVHLGQGLTGRDRVYDERLGLLVKLFSIGVAAVSNWV